jgi:uncharacterized protein YdiU (UPF0061 family)
MEQEEGSEEAALASAREALAAFEPRLETAREAGLYRKLGLFTERAGDALLVQNLLDIMAANRADFTLTFRRLSDAADSSEGYQGVRALFDDSAAYEAWAIQWRRRLEEDQVSQSVRATAMWSTNPAVIPRNHLVEEVIDAAVERQDFAPFEQLLEVISKPFEQRSNDDRYSMPARPEERVTQTFCGT